MENKEFFAEQKTVGTIKGALPHTIKTRKEPIWQKDFSDDMKPSVDVQQKHH